MAFKYKSFLRLMTQELLYWTLGGTLRLRRKKSLRTFCVLELNLGVGQIEHWVTSSTWERSFPELGQPYLN